jgi:type IV pilus assembly protein PilM
MTKALSSTLARRISKLVRKKESSILFGPIGIDFGVSSGTGDLRMVQFKKSANTLELHASAQVSITDGQRHSTRQFRAVIKQALKENGFVGHDVVTCIQPQEVKILMLSFMREANKDDEELIVQRIAERIDDDISNYVIDYMMVRPKAVDGQERSVLVALAHYDEVVNHLEYLRKAGLMVKLLEIEPTAIRRLISAKHEDEHETNLMAISIGHSQTYITVLSGRRLIYERDIEFGEQQLMALLCKELEMDEHEARTMLIRDGSNDVEGASATVALYSVLKPLFMELVEDINRALIYAASETRGLPVKQVYLTGEVATWNGIENFINTLIEVPVSVLTPLDEFKKSEKLAADLGARSAVVAGMALHGLTEVV